MLSGQGGWVVETVLFIQLPDRTPCIYNVLHCQITRHEIEGWAMNTVRQAMDMTTATTVWLFQGERGRFPSAVFSSRAKAEEWILKNNLTGVLTKYPVDAECLDWARRTPPANMGTEKREAGRVDSGLVASFTYAGQEHYHYEEGTA